MRALTLFLMILLGFGLAAGCKKAKPVEGAYETDQASAFGDDAREKPFVASILREPFHKGSCKWAKKINVGNLAGYDSRDGAIDDGHRPCKVCRP